MARADRPVRSDKEERRSDGIGHTIRSVEERREAVLELSFDGLSNRAITDVLGVDHATVLNDRKAIDSENSLHLDGDDTRNGENSPSSNRKAIREKNEQLAAKEMAAPTGMFETIVIDPP